MFVIFLCVLILAAALLDVARLPVRSFGGKFKLVTFGLLKGLHIAAVSDMGKVIIFMCLFGLSQLRDSRKLL